MSWAALLGTVSNQLVSFIVSFLDDCRNGNVTRLTDDGGYLALYRNPIGNRDSEAIHHLPGSYYYCPWVLDVEPGKKLRLTWKVTPSAQTVKNEVEVQRSSSSCHVSLRFRDGNDKVLTDGPCLSRAPPKDDDDDFSVTVFTSRDSRLEIHLVTETDPAGDQANGWTAANSASKDPVDQLPPYIIQYKGWTFLFRSLCTI